MKTMRVGFSRPSEWKIGSKIIQWSEGTDFSHAFLRWHSDSLDRDLVYQASHGMVHFVSGDRFDSENITAVEYSVELTDEQFNEIVRKCIDLAGVKYGTLQLLGMAIERVTGIRNPFRDGSKTFVCSELVGEVLRQVYTIDLDLEFVGPGQLEIVISNYPAFKRIS